MDKHEMMELLNQIKNNDISPEEALIRMKMEPFEDIGYAKVDYHRGIRQGANEVIYGAGKMPEQIAGIIDSMHVKGISNIIITRMSEESAKFVSKIHSLDYYNIPQFGIAYKNDKIDKTGAVLIVSGGTSDMRVCEEAALTAETLGSSVTRLYDVGVSGIHRLLSHSEQIMKARVIVAVAGMEGALASVVGGLADCPVIAVPTSVGYGANFGGLSALLSMLNSCASGLSVVNIDNGFGAGYLANMINKMESAEK